MWCHVKLTAEKCYTAILTKFQQSTFCFYMRSSTKHLYYYDYIPEPVDARIFNDTKGFQWNSKKYCIDNDYLWTTAVYFDLFWFWELKPAKAVIVVLSYTAMP